MTRLECRILGGIYTASLSTSGSGLDVMSVEKAGSKRSVLTHRVRMYVSGRDEHPLMSDLTRQTIYAGGFAP